MSRSLSLLLCLFISPALASLQECQQLQGADRLACSETLLKEYEAWFTRQGMPLLDNQELAASMAQQDFGIEQQRLAEKKQLLDKVEATVMGVQKDPYGKLTLTLDSKQIWKLADKGPRIKKGDRVEISRGALGAFYLKKSGTTRKARARRIQ